VLFIAGALVMTWNLWRTVREPASARAGALPLAQAAE
jgi:hypothetical protein